MKDTIMDKPVVDTYKEHARHNKYRLDCSTCHVARETEDKRRQYRPYNGINTDITLASMEASYQSSTNPFE